MEPHILQAANLFITTLDFVFRILVLLVIPALVVLVRQLMSLRREQVLLEQRASSLERALDRMPGEEGLHQLSLSVAALEGEAKAMREIMERIERVVGRHEEYLLSVGGGR